jgi:hypothetical protein
MMILYLLSNVIKQSTFLSCFYFQLSFDNLFSIWNYLNYLQESLESPFPQLVALESSSIDFVNDLECLDRLSPRSADSVHVFYMKSGQKGADEILNNVVSYFK